VRYLATLRMFKLDTYLGWRVDFASPPGAPAYSGPDSVSWRVFKNPIALGVGGAAAVVLEFADARIRTGVWEHSNYRADPIGRSTRTAMAAMIGVYGPQEAAQRIIRGVNNMHARVEGRTPSGERYRALDTELLSWVSATAQWGFLNAYHRFVTPLSVAEQERFYDEGAPIAQLFGVETPIRSNAQFDALRARLQPRFEPHPIVHEFLGIFSSGPGAMGVPARLRQAMARAAISLLPGDVRARLDLGPRYDLSPMERRVLRCLGAISERTPILSAPPAQASLRMGLPADFLYRSRPAQTRALARWARRYPERAAPTATYAR